MVDCDEREAGGWILETQEIVTKYGTLRLEIPSCWYQSLLACIIGALTAHEVDLGYFAVGKMEAEVRAGCGGSSSRNACRETAHGTAFKALGKSGPGIILVEHEPGQDIYVRILILDDFTRPYCTVL